jgi:hypothetical protein
MAVTKEPFIIDGEIVAEKQTLTDSSTSGVINATERSTEPSAPASGDIYLDDGTNSASGNPQWRRYTGSAWEDIGGGVASTVSDLEFDNADLTAGVLTITGLKTIASIVDNAGDTIAFADSVNYGASNTTVDLSSFGTITGTWKVKFAQGYGETTGATFLSQTDTPSSYSGQSGKVVAVNTGETALEFIDAGGGGLINTIASMTAETFSYPKTGVTNPFSNAANSPNIAFDVDNFDVETALLSTSSNEPMQIPKIFEIPTGVTNLIFRIVYVPDTGTWGSESIVWKGEYKTTTDNAAWSTVSAFNIGTDTAPASGSAPQVYEATVSLVTLGLSVGDSVLMDTFLDSTTTWATDIGFQSLEIGVS